MLSHNQLLVCLQSFRILVLELTEANKAEDPRPELALIE
jgi:hypothetical protein